MKKNLILLAYFMGFLVALWGTYVLLGHHIIRYLYECDAVKLLNIITRVQGYNPLELYLKQVDFIFYKKFFPVLVFTPVFAYIVWRIFISIFRCISASEEQRELREQTPRYGILAAATVYLVLTVLFYFPILQTLNSMMIGPPSDNLKHLWNQWWMFKVMFERGNSLTYTNYILYPQGTPLLYHAFSFYNMFLSATLSSILSRALLYNLLILHTYILAGVGAFLLIRYLAKDSYVAFLGAFIFAFSPFHFAHSLFHIESTSIQFIPFFLLFFIKSVRNEGKSNLFLAALFYLLISLCSWYFMIFTAYFMVFGYIYLAMRRRRIFLPDVFFKIFLIIGGTLLILSPWLLKMIIMGFKYPEVKRAGHNLYVADLFSFFTPGYYHWLGNTSLIGKINSFFTGNRVEKTAYLGIANLLIVILAFKGSIRKNAKYFCGFFVFLILSMGAYLHALGVITPILLPYRIIQAFPFLSHARVPSRCMVYVYLFWGLITALSVKYICKRISSLRLRKFFAVILPIIIFIDFFSICGDMTAVRMPDCYNLIKKDKEKFGILDLPSHGDARAVYNYMMYQTFHGIPLVQGNIARPMTSNTFFDHLSMEDMRTQRTQLSGNRVKYIVVHKRFISVLNPLDIDPYKKTYDVIWEDDDNVVLRVY